jgi:Skp family chaperone for outer membrane proteins
VIKSVAMTAVLCLLTASSAFAQAPAAAPASAATMPHKVGLIDMAYIFKNYKKFEDRRESLKADIAQTDEKAKAMAEGLKAIEAELKGGKYKPDSPEYQATEAKGFALKSQFEQFSAKAKRDFLNKESEIYKEVYLECSNAVKQYSEYYKYTLVIRFSRETIDGTEEARELIQGMNNLVIYHNPEFDISDKILVFLNQSYAKTTAANTTGTTTR